MTDIEVNDEVYPVFTYASTVLLVLVAVAQLLGFTTQSRLWILRDKSLILMGCVGRVGPFQIGDS